MTDYSWVGASGNWTTAAAWSPAGPPTASDEAIISERGTPYTVTVNSADAATTVRIQSAAATLADSGSLSVSKTLAIDSGTFDLMAGGSVTAGHIRVEAKGVLEGAGAIDSTVANGGKIEVSSGTLDFEKKVTGSKTGVIGTDTVSGGATLEFGKAVAGQEVIYGAGGGTLELLEGGLFTGSIDAFAAGDTISLAHNWAFSSLTNPTSGTTDLTLTSLGGVTHTFDFIGTLAASNFVIHSGPTTTITYA